MPTKLSTTTAESCSYGAVALHNIIPGSCVKCSTRSYLSHVSVHSRHFDSILPEHFLCYECCIYHPRSSDGDDYAELRRRWVKKGVYYKGHKRVESVRVWVHQRIPWYDVQSAARAARYGSRFGNTLLRISNKKGKRGWKHSMRSLLVDGHFIFRYDSIRDYTWEMICHTEVCSGQVVTGSLFPPCCGHFIDGLFSLICCAMSHIRAKPAFPRLCSRCSILTRCPECPSEYMISVGEHSKPAYTLRISRWTDLGDGRDPTNRLWQAACGSYPISYQGPEEIFDMQGLATARSRFEAAIGNDVSDQIVSCAPKPPYQNVEADITTSQQNIQISIST